VRAITGVGAGASDNARGLATSSGQKHTTSVFGTTRLGLELGYAGAGATHHLLYVLGATAYPDNPGANNLTHELSLESAFSFERSTLELVGSASYGVTNAVAPLIDNDPLSTTGPDRPGPPPLPPPRPDDELGPAGDVGYLGGSFAESLSVELDPLWSLYQDAGIDAFSTVIGSQVDPAIWSANADLGLERAWPRDAARIEASAGYESTPHLVFEDEVIEAEQGEVGRAGLGWAHQFSPGWRSDLSGAVFAARAALTDPWSYGPAWRGSLAWRGRAFRAAAIYDHGASPSVNVGGIFLTDRVTVRGTGRFGQDEKYRFTGSLRYQRMSILGPAPPFVPPPRDPNDPEPPPPPGPDDMRDVAQRWQAQVLLGARPWPRRHIELALSYRVTSQTGAILGRRRLRTFERNLVLLTLTVAFPTTGQ
jgi:hypothetical protein